MSTTFSKRQILLCDKFMEYRDVLSALLNETQEYTVDEVNDIVNDFGEKVFVRMEDDVL